MGYEGVLANALVTLLAGGCYAYVAAERHHRADGSTLPARAVIAFFAAVTVALGAAGLNQAISVMGTPVPHVPVEAFLFHVSMGAGVLASLPLVYFVSHALWGRTVVSAAVTGLLAIPAAAVLALLVAGGVTGPHPGPWGSTWTIGSRVARVLFLVFTTAPTLAAGGTLVYVGSRTGSGTGRRLRLVGWSVFVYAASFALDAYGVRGVAPILARAAVAVGGVLAYCAYVDPRQGVADPRSDVWEDPDAPPAGPGSWDAESEAGQGYYTGLQRPVFPPRGR